MQEYMTKPRKRLLNYLAEHRDERLCAKQIAGELENVSVSAVYRNLSALEQDGRVRRVSVTGSREIFYQYLDCASCRDHLHLSCKKCGKTFHMDEQETAQLAEALEKLDGFELDRGQTVLYGICGSCKTKNEK